ncbi:MAG: hypothetical protein J0L67_19070 [Cytophagales bacterium]|nr:hypothetical protein [Cytophagales bacterium]
MKLIILLLVFSVIGIVLSCSQKHPNAQNKNEESIFPQEELTKKLNLPNGKELFVRAKIWGISSNHEEIVFSENPITIADKEKDYIFYTDKVFYKINGDTLSLYACACDTSEPKFPFKGVKIMLNDLKTSSQIKNYSDNYKKFGLEKMSIYKE